MSASGLSQTGYTRSRTSVTRAKRMDRREQRARCSPGYPWLRQFESREEVDDYLSGDRIVCLLCGRSFRNLASHLAQTHKMQADHYREQYGIPKNRALMSEDSLACRSVAARGSAAVMAHARALAARNNATGKNVTTGPKAAQLPTWLRRERADATRVYADADFDAVLDAVATGRTIGEVLADEGRPSDMAWRSYCRKRPEYRARYAAIWDALPFSVQARAHRLGPRFRAAVRDLFEAGLSDHEAAPILGVTAMTVNRVTKPWRRKSA